MSNQSAVRLRFYDLFARPNRPRGYTGKILVVAFVGTHVPLLCLTIYGLYISNLPPYLLARLLWVVLFATLSGTGLTLLALHFLLEPIRQTSAGLRRYLETGVLPELPTLYRDEAGLLMADTQRALKQLNEVFMFMEGYDRLTALMNRDSFWKRADEVLTDAPKSGGCVLFVVEVQGVQSVNERMGRDAGDTFLCGVADRLGAKVMEGEILARTGSKQFALLSRSVSTVEQAIGHARRLHEALEAPITVKQQTLPVSAIIGAALLSDVPSGESPAEELLRAAELALHQARNASEGIAFYSADADATIRRRLTLDEDLRHAIERGELRVVYQPQVEFDSGRITVAEALLRWEHPLFGAVSPQEFVPIAEEAGLITRIGEWVLKTACEQNKAWQDAGLPPLVIAVNLSPRQFAQKDLCKVVSRVLKETGLAPQCLELEITESLAMENAAHTADVLQELHKIGVTVSLDDFGTGFSSLSYLGRLPLDVLKIDRSFVRELTQNPQIEAVTRGTVALAKSLRLDVVVEGVETLEQFVLLRNIGFARLQGFFFSQPVGAEPFADLLRADVLSWSKDWALG